MLLRFVETSRVPNTSLLNTDNQKTDIEILFVCAAKDIQILPNAIKNAMVATAAHNLKKVAIVVPEIDLLHIREACRGISELVVVVSENLILPADQIFELKQHFGHRAGWVIQQLLKIEYVSKAEVPGVLVCDSDTLLIQPRVWMNSNEEQLLTPTWEWHPAYYEFLSKLNLSSLKPKYTFVPHHMLMQPKFIREVRQLLGWNTLSEIRDYLVTNSETNEMSPFSVDYELYAQFMFKFHRDKVLLSKWSNLEQLRFREEKNEGKYRKYNSISFHDHLI